MTDTAELIARLLNYAEHGFASDHKTDCVAAADALSSLVRERDAKHMMFLYEADKHSEWLEKYIALKARCEAAEAARDEAMRAAHDQPHGPTSRILWSTRYGELLDDYKDLQAENEKMRKALASLEPVSWGQR